MRFLDPKEEVINIKLTSLGKRLLSLGVFKPEYYAFFDTDIVYDLNYLSGTGNVSEPQNNIQERILDKTPRFEGQTSFEGCETTVFSPGGSAYAKQHIFPNLYKKKYDDSYNIEVVEKPINQYYLQNPIGKSAYSTDEAPFFSLQMLTGAISGAVLFDGSGSSDYFSKHEEIPSAFIKQVNISLSNEIMINTGQSELAPTKELDNDELFDSFYIFTDGSTMSYEKKKAFFTLEEGNTHFLKENFDIEVYEVTEQTVMKKQPDGTEKEETTQHLRKLYFVQDDEHPATNNVEYYFNIFVDNEIDKNYYCSALKNKKKNKTKDIFSDNTFKCPDEGEETINLNIYNTHQTQESGDNC